MTLAQGARAAYVTLVAAAHFAATSARFGDTAATVVLAIAAMTASVVLGTLARDGRAAVLPVFGAMAAFIPFVLGLAAAYPDGQTALVFFFGPFWLICGIGAGWLLASTWRGARWLRRRNAAPRSPAER